MASRQEKTGSVIEARGESTGKRGSIHEEAAAAAHVEKELSFRENIALYPKAAAWSVLLSTAIVMEGFDLVLINSLFAVPAFQEAFGVKLADGTYQITAPWQAGLSNGALMGELLGLTLNGIIADRFGFKKTMIGALSLVICFIFIVFFIQGLPQLLIGLILMGIPWGVFQTLTTTYAAEVCPTGLRPYLTTYVNLCWVFGQFLASGVLKGVSGINDQWAYRIPYALQWVWPVPLIIGIAFAPESPWWLIRKERYEDAKHSLMRLTSRNSPHFNVDERISMMQQTNAFEKSLNEGTSYLDCFKGTDLRRTEIVCMVWLVQSLCGASFMGYSTYFYEQAGLNTSYAFDLSWCQYALGAIGTILSWFLMPRFGRRTLYVWGQGILVCLLLIIGFCGIPAKQDNSGAKWAIGSMLLIFTFFYDFSVGPVCYSLVAEIPSTRLRQKSVVLARNVYNIGGIFNNIITTRQLNPSAWNWGPYSAFFWAGTGFILFVWSYFRLPEPKGRTYGELDILFAQKIPARKFASTIIDPTTTSHVMEEKIEGTQSYVEKVA